MFWPPPRDEDEGCVVDLKGLEEKSDGLHIRKGCMFVILACAQLTQHIIILYNHRSKNTTRIRYTCDYAECCSIVCNGFIVCVCVLTIL